MFKLPLFRVLAFALCLLLVAVAAPAQQQDRWQGVIDLSGFGQREIEFFVTFTLTNDGAAAATLTIPAQNATNVALIDVVYDDDRMEFTLVTSPNNGVFRAVRDGDTATGTLTQGVEIPIRINKMAADEVVAGPARPQTPVAPFPYAVREVSYLNTTDGNGIAGTLTLPAGAGPHPAVLMITGSGAQDRDETIFEHKPFWVIADHLSRSGIAVLRVDDRGIGGSDRGPDAATSLNYAGDVLAGVDYLARQSEIDADKIGLIGHSEGGLIAPIAATRTEQVAFIVLLAGPGISGKDLMPLQLAAIQRSVGRPQDNIDRQLAAQADAHALVIDGADESEVRAAVARLVGVQLETVAPQQRAQVDLDQAAQVATAQMMSAWYRTFLITDPRDALSEVTCPVLALNGTLDLQVPADANLSAIEETLRAAGNEDVTVQALDGLNHLFQSATTGSVAEYGQIEETFSPAALDRVTDWIRARTAAR